ncbi:serine hydrolase domain-containing protein [Roseivirga echinicomitans]
MKKTALILLFFIFLYSCSKSTELKVQLNPESIGVSPEKLAEIDQLILKAIAEEKLPGGTFLLAKNGQIVYDKSFGYRTSEKVKAYQNNDIYRIASMTKAITTVSIMQLYEQGKIGLDDPVYNYIPSFKNQVVLNTFEPSDSSFTTKPVEKPVTIRNLLTHTSGIIYGSFNPGKLMAVYEKYNMNVGFSHPTWTTEEWIDRLAEVPLAHQPGAKFSYGLSMDVLGRVIEVVSNQPLDEYFKQHIFDKVGMTNTYFYLPKEKFDRLVPVYTQAQGKLITLDEIGAAAQASYPMEGPRNIFAGGGGLTSTAMDYAKFINTLALGGGDILGAEALKEMSSDQMPNVITDYKENNTGQSFGLGFTVYLDSENKRSPKSAGTYEWSGYFNTKFFIDPKEEIVFVGMTQIVPFNDNAFWNEMYKLIYEAVEIKF